MTASDLSRILHGKRLGHGKYVCKCPSHDDSSPSLSVRDGKSAVLIKCWTGCENEDILNSMGLTFSDLFYSGTKPSPKALREAERKRAIEERERAEKRRLERESIDMGWKWEKVRNSLGLLLMKSPQDVKLLQLFNHATDMSRVVTPSAIDPNPMLYGVFEKRGLLEGVNAGVVGAQVMRYLKDGGVL